MDTINIEGNKVKVTNPEKILWPKLGIRKIDYLSKLVELAPYIISYTKDKFLTTIRYPDGVNNKSFFQKSISDSTPNWVKLVKRKETNYILLNNLSTLIWLGNLASLEFHISFNSFNKEDYPSYLVFDLDPSEDQTFEDVIEVALRVYDTLRGLNINSVAKTSGASGIQIYIQTGEKYDYYTCRQLNEFFANYFSQKYPKLITTERFIKNRGKRLYFDYLQMWYGKTIIAPYSPRATDLATVSTPLEWSEIENGVKPEDFTLLNIKKRLDNKGDIFSKIIEDNSNINNLDEIIKFINNKS